MTNDDTGATRVDGRSNAQVRSLLILPGTTPYAEGSAEVQFGTTKVLVTASAYELESDEEEGQISASLSMLPRSVHLQLSQNDLDLVIRHELEALEKLVEQSLYSAAPAAALKRLSFDFSCHIVCSDAGIATAALSGCWVSLHQALRWASLKGYLAGEFELARVASISGGITNNRLLVDLCAEEAAMADFTANFVFHENGSLVDIRGNREGGTTMPESLAELLKLTQSQAETLFHTLTEAIS